jgi:hypothetical protein
LWIKFCNCCRLYRLPRVADSCGAVIFFYLNSEITLRPRLFPWTIFATPQSLRLFSFFIMRSIALIVSSSLSSFAHSNRDSRWFLRSSAACC